MQNQIMPKQSARATKEETRKKDHIKKWRESLERI
jgi:hypothetical protein